MRKRKGYPFQVLPPNKLFSKLFSTAIYMDDPQYMCTLLIGIGNNYGIPVEVARAFHKRLGDTIERADRINEYKINHGYNPAFDEFDEDEEE